MPELICPRCERDLGPEHDAKACQEKLARGMSRRFFFGIAFGALAAVVTPKAAERFLPTFDEMYSLIRPTLDTAFTKSPLIYRVGDGKPQVYYGNSPFGLEKV